MNQRIQLDKNNSRKMLRVNPEYNYNLISLFFPYWTEKYKDYSVLDPQVTVRYEVKDRYSSVVSKGQLLEGVKSLFNKQNNGFLQVDPKMELIKHGKSTDLYSIEFIAEFQGWEDFKIELEIENIPLSINIDDPLKTFKDHLDQEQNSRILFSAPFGHGKTTFLNYFFEQTANEYEVFHLFPVNYSVASNEDIFQYIKAEVLFQLMGKDVDFDKESFEKRITLPFYLNNESLQLIVDLFIPLFQLYPKIGKPISDAVKGIVKICKDYIKYNNEIQIDDKKVAEQYINRLYEKEGSIIEDNFFTQLIRQLNEQIQNKGKKTVLVIDDTDRMDPAHIFRILNVFAAHFDTDSNKEEGYSNKLGFDKVIIVTDYDNLRYIFQHLYGLKTHFEGYINKFYSKSIFKFDNRKAISHFIKKTWDIGRSRFKYLGFILSDLHSAGLLSLRELLMIGNTSKSADLSLPNQNGDRFLNFCNELWLLSQVIGFSRLLDNLSSCQQLLTERIVTKADYNKLSSYALASLVYEQPTPDDIFVFEHKQFKLRFKIIDTGNHAEVELKSMTISPDYPNFEFKYDNFYSLLASLASTYRNKFGISY